MRSNQRVGIDYARYWFKDPRCRFHRFVPSHDVSQSDVADHGHIWINPFNSLQWMDSSIGEDFFYRIAFNVAMTDSIDEDKQNGTWAVVMVAKYSAPV
jgi:hypothetical protein